MNTNLDDERILSIFHELIEPAYPTKPSKHPTLCMVGAQPGAGKTRTIQAVLRAHPDMVEVSGDDLRVYHPDYARMLDEDPIRMPEQTSHASGTWVHMSLDYLRKHRVSVAVETTFAHPDTNTDTLQSFRQAGYRTDIILVATPAPISLLGILERYARQLHDYGTGRWTDPTYHDRVIRQVPETIEQIAASGLADAITVTDREGSIIAETYTDDYNHKDRKVTAAQLRQIAEDRLSPTVITDMQRKDAAQTLAQIRHEFDSLSAYNSNVTALIQQLESLFD